jgi:hypothetical protein
VKPEFYPFFLLFITISLMLPNQVLKKRKKQYLQMMKENIWLENYKTITNDQIRTWMVAVDKECRTTSIREITYNSFADSFAEAFLEALNESDLGNRAKVNRIEKVRALLTMNFEVVAVTKLKEAIDKLEGKVNV